MQTYRAWVNQPSTQQVHHNLHGTKCIVQDKGGPIVTIWFTDGPIHSMRINRQAIVRIHISSAG